MKKPMSMKMKSGAKKMVKDKDADGYKRGGMVKPGKGKAC